MNRSSSRDIGAARLAARPAIVELGLARLATRPTPRSRSSDLMGLSAGMGLVGLPMGRFPMGLGFPMGRRSVDGLPILLTLVGLGFPMCGMIPPELLLRL